MKLKTGLLTTTMLILALLATAQNYNINQSSNAVMLQVNENTTKEIRLNNIFVALPNGSNQLHVRLIIPNESINDSPSNDSLLSPGGLPCNLTININPWQIVNNLTSAKTYLTKAFLTLNNITKAVSVKYMPLPVGTELDGDFNLSVIVEFNPIDFNLPVQQANSQFVIKISDTRVARL